MTQGLTSREIVVTSMRSLPAPGHASLLQLSKLAINFRLRLLPPAPYGRRAPAWLQLELEQRVERPARLRRRRFDRWLLDSPDAVRCGPSAVSPPPARNASAGD